MNKTIENMLYEAALTASQEMGSDLKNMSCFISNWGDLTCRHDENEMQEDLVAA
ncbi:MAG: hypothetical protein HIU82_19485 [Proteobacteria bacterium]|nr:hypothetical protein [Pseudomonadota bacterium]